jgi:hypothetical protein
MAPEISDKSFLTRNATADALTEAGFPMSPATLATKATRGGGPPFRRFGRRPLYKWGDALRWAKSRLSPLIANTSELAQSEPAQRSEKRGASPPRRPRSRPRKGAGSALELA